MSENPKTDTREFGELSKQAHEASRLRRFACGLPLAARDVEYQPEGIVEKEEANETGSEKS